MDNTAAAGAALATADTPVAGIRAVVFLAAMEAATEAMLLPIVGPIRATVAVAIPMDAATVVMLPTASQGDASTPAVATSMGDASGRVLTMASASESPSAGAILPTADADTMTAGAIGNPRHVIPTKYLKVHP